VLFYIKKVSDELKVGDEFLDVESSEGNFTVTPDISGIIKSI